MHVQWPPLRAALLAAAAIALRIKSVWIWRSDAKARGLDVAAVEIRGRRRDAHIGVGALASAGSALARTLPCRPLLHPAAAPQAATLAACLALCSEKALDVFDVGRMLETWARPCVTRISLKRRSPSHAYASVL